MWVRAIDPKYWARAFFLATDTSFWTSNMAESINLKASRKLPIVFLVQKTRMKMAYLFLEMQPGMKIKSHH